MYFEQIMEGYKHLRIKKCVICFAGFSFGLLLGFLRVFCVCALIGLPMYTFLCT
jgi:hypothetical protein